MYKDCTASFVVSIKWNGHTPDITEDNVVCLLSKGKDEVLTILADCGAYGKLGKAVFSNIINIPAGTYKYSIIWDRETETHMLETGYVEVADV